MVDAGENKQTEKMVSARFLEAMNSLQASGAPEAAQFIWLAAIHPG